MTPKERRRIFLTVIRETYVYKILISYLVSFAAIALLILIVDPQINSYKDALWYCFVSCTTIGFGDLSATVVASRILTVVLYIMTVFLMAVLTALFTQIFFELMKRNNEELVSKFAYELEHVDTLSEEELKELARKIKGKVNGKE